MKHIFFFATILCLFCACQKNEFSVERENLLVTGNQYQYIGTTNAIPTSSYLPQGSQLLFNATGGLTLSDKIFTFNGSEWVCNEPLLGTSIDTPIQFTAVSPVLQSYNQNNIYIDGNLTDIVYAQQSITAKQPIELDLKHLFSKLTFTIDPSFKDELEALKLTVSKQIKKLEINSSSISPLIEDKEISTTYTCDGKESYSFIIPSTSNIKIQLAVIYRGKTSIHTIEQNDFKSGHAYMCNIKKKENQIGISSVQDLIIFSLLYVQSANYKGPKTLADFGTTENGITTYRLLNDITFTDDLKEPFIGIGTLTTQFKDVFDGQGYKISNLSSNYFKNKTHKGLFEYIDIKGLIKNLTIEGSIINNQTNGKNFGFLATCNYGNIINCSITNSSIQNNHFTDSPIIGLLTGYSSGTIINCSVTDCTIEEKTSNGGICGACNGNIINSYVANTSINNNKVTHGGICATNSSKTKIKNCYAKVKPTNSKNNLFAITSNQNGASLNNCYYHRLNVYTGSTPTNSKGEKINVSSFDKDFITNKSKENVTDLLNNWVSAHQNEYETLFHWQKNTQHNIPAIFIK